MAEWEKVAVALIAVILACGWVAWRYRNAATEGEQECVRRAREDGSPAVLGFVEYSLAEEIRQVEAEIAMLAENCFNEENWPVTLRFCSAWELADIVVPRQARLCRTIARLEMLLEFLKREDGE